MTVQRADARTHGGTLQRGKVHVLTESFFFSSSYWKHRGYGPKDKETAFLAMLPSNPEHITHEKIKKINTNKNNEIKIADKNNDAIPIVYGTK